MTIYFYRAETPFYFIMTNEPLIMTKDKWIKYAKQNGWVLKNSMPSYVIANATLMVFVTPEGKEVHVEVDN